VHKGVDVLGYLSSESGLGEAGRLLVNALRSVNYPVLTTDMPISSARGGSGFHVDNMMDNPTLIVAINSLETPAILSRIPKNLIHGKHLIGQWFWELEYFPPSMHMGFRHVNDVWAPTKFITDAIQKYAPPKVRVECMPLPLLAPTFDTEISKIDIGIDLDRYMFLFSFSFFSVFGRKNPVATIEAFKKAFKPDEGPILVIKSINGDRFPKQLAYMKGVAEGRKDIKFIDDTLEPLKMAALLNMSDCYVSLHRSEGLGLSISEAMALGKPVIATNYSGNTEFMNDYVSLLMPWEYTEIGEGNDVYPPNAKWAEVDVTAASQAMRYVYEHQDSAKIMGQHAKEHIETHFSLEATGKRMAEYLDSL
jgi:glycosyltransferase involved in cell wall biosynthesis